MRTCNNIYNTLIQREKYPPLSHCDSVSYNTSNPSESSPLSDTGKHRSGRVVLFLFVAMVSLLSLSCTKEDGDEGDSGNVVTYQEQEWDWGDSSKYNPGGFTLDTTWDGDTTIYF